MSTIPSIGTNVAESSISTLDGNTLYVGGSGEGNYSSIQDAIDNASRGDTIYVYSGIYYENIVVDKSINLIGEDRNLTIIDGNLNEVYVLRITTDWVNVSEFTIKNGGDGIEVFSNHNTINDNILTDNILYGISFNNIHDNIIIGNNISKNSGGIELLESRDNIIMENKITHNIGHHINFGIYLCVSDCNNISKNIISYSPLNIRLYSSHENIISNNLISNGFHRNVQTHFGNNNIICSNTIANSTYCGLQIESRGNKVFQNNFINNTEHASFTLFLRGFNYNKWDSNYWDNWIGLDYPLLSKFPKIIKGALTRSKTSFPVFAFDWHPAQQPYEIP